MQWSTTYQISPSGYLVQTARRPLFADSRYISGFAKVLSNSEAVDYLRSSLAPSFDVALQKAGVEDEEIETQLKEASIQMELALSKVHLYVHSEPIQRAMVRLAQKRKGAPS